MMDAVTSRAEKISPPEVTPYPRRWGALGVLCLMQFMLVLDMTIVNIALPQIQHSLGFTHSGLAWVVNGYILMAGGLLLLGGRLADIYGRRRLFLTGVVVFGASSALCAAAIDPAMLLAGRFIEGSGEALAAPASLGLIAVMFTDPKERAKALGMWGGIAGLAGVSGTVISGVLTDLASWRWIFYINIPVALIAVLMASRVVPESRMTRAYKRIDFPGAILGTGGLVAVVDGLLQASTHPWGTWQVLLPLLGGIAALATMVLVEARTRQPLIPLDFFTNRTRTATNFITLFQASGFFSYVFLLTLFEQQVLGYSPLKGGLGYLPLGVGLGLGVGISAGMMGRVGVKPLLAIGFFGSAAALLMTTWMVHVGSSYAGGILPGMLVMGIFSGLCFPTTVNASLHEVTSENASLASGVQTAMQQVGGAIGLAFLVTLALRTTAGQVSHGIAAGVAAAHGYALALRIAAGMLIVGGILILLLFERVSGPPRNALGEVQPERAPKAPKAKAASAA
jgi:EmrB/QacA subfamily drug resistance transporter